MSYVSLYHRIYPSKDTLKLYLIGKCIYSIIYNNETVWTVEENQGLNEYSFNMSNVSGNLTILIQSSGSDSQTDNKPGDFFIARTHIEMWDEE